MLCSLYQGNVNIWNYESQTLVKSFEVCDLPVRAAKFIPRKNWVVTGSDDMQVRVFNYNTLERVHAFEAHSDYIRSIAVHPTQPFILTSSGSFNFVSSKHSSYLLPIKKRKIKKKTFHFFLRQTTC